MRQALGTTLAHAAVGPPTLPSATTAPAAGAGVTEHQHETAGRPDWPWFPAGVHKVLVAHPYCVGCGSVKSLGASRALDLGGLSNLLARLERRMADGGVRFTEAQRRLVMRRLENQGASDEFSISKVAQVALLCQVVAASLGLGPGVVESYLRSC